MDKNIQTKIGIIGGGQLGKMLIEAALPWNVPCYILENDKEAPASHCAHKQILGTLSDADKIKELSQISDVLTYEIEHINVEILEEIYAKGKEIIPFPAVLKMIQDKGLQKEFYQKNNIPTSPFVLIKNKEDWKTAIEKFDSEKVAVKLCKGGYDGKGVEICFKKDIQNGLIPFDAPCIIEEFIPCEKELAVMVAIGKSGKTVTFPLVEMVFDEKVNLVDTLACPARVSENIEKEAKEIALQVAKALNSPGIFAIEMFLDKNNKIYVNETAPRPHNSGHHTIEACNVSQYGQLLRILCGIDPVEVELFQPAVMMNVLGPENVNGEYRLENLDKILSISGVHLHLYNKKISKPSRKLGHITVMASSLQKAFETIEFIKNNLKISEK